MFNIEKFAKHFTGRRALSILIIIILLHVVLMSFYLNDERVAHRSAKRFAMIQKIVNVINLIYATPVNNREHAVSAMSDPYITATITKQPKWPVQFSTISYWEINQALHKQLNNFAISIKLNPNQWLNINATIYTHILVTQFIIFLVEILVFGFILFAFWSINRYARPFRNFKKMADQLGLDIDSEPVPIKGPLIVQEAATAMNQMRERIRDLIRDRTQMLAAISHDLRTPITRMKLRLHFIDDSETVETMQADMAEMEAMITEVLAFARDESSSEKKVNLDLVSLLDTICESYVEMGRPVNFKTEVQRAVIIGKSLALKRALSNLIGNGLRYANNVDVCLSKKNKRCVIRILDDGPGIPETDLENVFAPFYRAESSRSRDTGGVGLGLAVTRDIIKAHGGEIVLSNRKPHGLEVVIIL